MRAKAKLRRCDTLAGHVDAAVVGVDPGTRRTGAALVWQGVPLSATVWRWPGGTDLGRTVDGCREAVEAAVVAARETVPDAGAVVVAVEVVTWRVSARQQACSGAMLGAVSAAAARSGVELVQVSPAAAKLALAGRGNAGKAEMVAAVVRRYGETLLRGIEGRARGDAADAVGIALAGEALLRRRALLRRAETRRDRRR